MGTPDGAISLKERVLLELARRDKSDVRDTFRAITEAAAVVLDVARVGIWRLSGPHRSAEGTKLVCRDLYLLHEREHVSQMPIHGRDFPTYLFFKAHAETKQDPGGLGIGLHLSREIIRHHGGELSFESTVGRGSTFRFQLPLAEGGS